MKITILKFNESNPNPYEGLCSQFHHQFQIFCRCATTFAIFFPHCFPDCYKLLKIGSPSPGRSSPLCQDVFEGKQNFSPLYQYRFERIFPAWPSNFARSTRGGGVLENFTRVFNLVNKASNMLPLLRWQLIISYFSHNVARGHGKYD